MTPIGTNDEIGADGHVALCCRGPQADDLFAFEEQIGYLDLHFELEFGILPGVLGYEVQKIPLRHHGDEAAAGWQMRKICELDEILTDLRADRPRWLMRPPEKFLQRYIDVSDGSTQRIGKLPRHTSHVLRLRPGHGPRNAQRSCAAATCPTMYSNIC